MAVYKCKMCGGDLNITDLDNVVVCDYCGTTQTGKVKGLPFFEALSDRKEDAIKESTHKS